ncbi:uncharacterized protein LOC103829885 [Brassica rapa]|uniref:uncharacterized protein LOC103829885 n=1 Tax=Brassica campestris TaxID=3711 RepID=UPI0004F1B2CE|nr:uncharacterized protein LOC103829885 [Brassica rapa]
MTFSKSDPPQEWELAQSPTAPTLSKSLSKSHPPPQSMDLSDTTILCNTDGAWKADSVVAGSGWVFRDKHQEVGRGGRSHHHVASPLLAEALAIRDALLHAFSLGFTSIWLRSDAQALVTAITTKRRPTELYGVLSDIDSISSLFSVCRFSFCPRASNGLADTLAKAHLCIAPLGQLV